MKDEADNAIPPLQFGLKSLLGSFAIVSLAFVAKQWFLTLSDGGGTWRYYWCSVGIYALFGLSLGYFTGHCCARLMPRTAIQPRIRRAVCVLLFISFCLTGYFVWGTERWWWIDIDYKDRRFPYPDDLILTYHNWLDAKYPAGPNQIKMHGEFYPVLRHLAYLMIALLFSVGMWIGFLTPTLPRAVMQKLNFGKTAH